MQEFDAAAAAAAAQAAAMSNGNSNGGHSSSPHSNKNIRQNSVANEMIKELKKRNPMNMNQPRTRQHSKKEINIEDLIEEINRGDVTADAERRKRQRTQEIKKDFAKTTQIQII